MKKYTKKIVTVFALVFGAASLFAGSVSITSGNTNIYAPSSTYCVVTSTRTGAAMIYGPNGLALYASNGNYQTANSVAGNYALIVPASGGQATVSW